MEKLTVKTFIKRLEELPLDIREGVLNIDFLAGLENIQQSNRLHIDQGASLENLTFHLILGDIDENQYMSDLQNELIVDPELASKIATEVNTNILAPIRAEIKRIEDEAEKIDEAIEIQNAPEEPEELRAADILSDIEMPEPSIGVQHEVMLPNTETPEPKPAAVVKQEVPQPASTVTPQVPSGWPTANAVQPISNIRSTLNQKLEQPTITKTSEIQHSIDPYKEPVE